MATSNMLGGLHIVSFSLALGGLGQSWFYSQVPSGSALRLLLGVPFLLWFYMYIVTYKEVLPFGLRTFRYSLTLVKWVYASLVVGAELLNRHYQFPGVGGFHIGLARVFMYLGFVGPIFYLRAMQILRRWERAAGDATRSNEESK